MRSPSLPIAGIVVGTILALGPLWANAFTTILMMKSKGTLNEHGIANPHLLASNIGDVLTSMVIGWVACPLGILLATISLIFLILSFSSTPARDTRTI